MKNLYERIEEKRIQGDINKIISKWGEGTEFEALSVVTPDEETGQWDGYLIFKNEQYSPLIEGAPGFQFKHCVGSTANGVMADFRAERLWTTLTDIFKTLMQAEGSK